MERNELAIREALVITGRQLAHIDSKLPALVTESKAVERRMWELQTQSFGERVVRWFLRWLHLDGKHRELKALEAHHLRLSETIDRYHEQRMALEANRQIALTQIWAIGDIGRAAEEELNSINDESIRESVKLAFRKALNDFR